MRYSQRTRIESGLEGQPIGSGDGELECMECWEDVRAVNGMVHHALAEAPKRQRTGWHIKGVFCDTHRTRTVPVPASDREQAIVVVVLEKRGDRYVVGRARVTEYIPLNRVTKP